MEDLKILKEDYSISFQDKDGNTLAYVTYPLIEEGVVNINRTYVDGTLRGQGIAKKLMDLVYEDLVKRGLKARITCSYAVKYFSLEKDKYKNIKIS